MRVVAFLVEIALYSLLFILLPIYILSPGFYDDDNTDEVGALVDAILFATVLFANVLALCTFGTICTTLKLLNKYKQKNRRKLYAMTWTLPPIPIFLLYFRLPPDSSQIPTILLIFLGMLVFFQLPVLINYLTYSILFKKWSRVWNAERANNPSF